MTRSISPTIPTCSTPPPGNRSVWKTKSPDGSPVKIGLPTDGSSIGGLPPPLTGRASVNKLSLDPNEVMPVHPIGRNDAVAPIAPCHPVFSSQSSPDSGFEWSPLGSQASPCGGSMGPLSCSGSPSGDMTLKDWRGSGSLGVSMDCCTPLLERMESFSQLKEAEQEYSDASVAREVAQVTLDSSISYLKTLGEKTVPLVLLNWAMTDCQKNLELLELADKRVQRCEADVVAARSLSGTEQGIGIGTPSTAPDVRTGKARAHEGVLDLLRQMRAQVEEARLEQERAAGHLVGGGEPVYTTMLPDPLDTSKFLLALPTGPTNTHIWLFGGHIVGGVVVPGHKRDKVLSKEEKALAQQALEQLPGQKEEQALSKSLDRRKERAQTRLTELIRDQKDRSYFSQKASAELEQAKDTLNKAKRHSDRTQIAYVMGKPEVTQEKVATVANRLIKAQCRVAQREQELSLIQQGIARSEYEREKGRVIEELQAIGREAILRATQQAEWNTIREKLSRLAGSSKKQ